jgi:TRAP-type C4-dicarboxylate transport system permease small subunit
MEKKKTTDILRNLDIYIAGIAFTALVLITFSGVVMRYIFGRPFIWEEEIQTSLFVWVAFFGGSAAFRTHCHVEISMVYDMLPVKAKKILTVLIYIAVILGLGYLFVQSTAMVVMFAETKKYTSVLSIPCSFLYGIIPVCCVLMVINYTLDTFVSFKNEFGTLEEVHT